jgi:hypothetical protein
LANRAPESDLQLVSLADDRARRGRLAAVLGLCLLGALVVALEGGFETRANLLALVVLAPGLVIGLRGGAWHRALAFFSLPRIREESALASKLMAEGDIEGARRIYARLLVTARPLGGFHALHVFMYGITSYYLGNVQEALLLARRVIDSGWLSHPRMQSHRGVVETWTVLMLAESGKIEDAKKLLEASGASSLSTGNVVVALYEARWQDALSAAKDALAAPATPSQGRPTLAALGLFAAKKLGQADEAAAFEKVLATEPLGRLAKQNPALARFL